MCTLFSDPELFHALQQRSTPVYCPKARTLFRQGDTPTGLYILNRGEATLWTDISGRGFVGFIQEIPMALLGLPSVIDAKPHVHSAIAHSGAQLSFVPLKDLTSLMQSDSSLFFKVLQLLAVEVLVAHREVLQPLCVCAERATSLLPNKETCAIVPVALVSARSSATFRRSAHL